MVVFLNYMIIFSLKNNDIYMMKLSMSFLISILVLQECSSQQNEQLSGIHICSWNGPMKRKTPSWMHIIESEKARNSNCHHMIRICCNTLFHIIYHFTRHKKIIRLLHFGIPDDNSNNRTPPFISRQLWLAPAFPCKHRQISGTDNR